MFSVTAIQKVNLTQRQNSGQRVLLITATVIIAFSILIDCLPFLSNTSNRVKMLRKHTTVAKDPGYDPKHSQLPVIPA